MLLAAAASDAIVVDAMSSLVASSHGTIVLPRARGRAPWKARVAMTCQCVRQRPEERQDFIAGGKPQSYVALLNPAGARLWEKVGQPGDEVTGVAAATAQFKNRVFVVGSQQTNDVPVRTDGAIWVYFADGESVFIQPPVTLRAPFTPDELDPDEKNWRSEWVRAVTIHPGTGHALTVGEREFSPDGNLLFSRAFTVQVHPLGDAVGAPWTSWAPGLQHDAARSVGVCADDFLIGGWTRDHIDPNAKPQPIMFWLEADKHRHLPQLGATRPPARFCTRRTRAAWGSVWRTLWAPRNSPPHHPRPTP